MKKTASTLAATGLLVAALSACSVPTAGVATPAAAANAPAASNTTATGAQHDTRSIAVSYAAPATVPTDASGDPADRVLYDAEALQPLLDEFWTQELADNYGLAFDTPDRFEFYVDNGNSTCAGQEAPGDDNAYYCSFDGDEYVAFDVEWLSSFLDENPGNAVTFLVLAHEWGHAVQDTWVEQEPGVDFWEGPAQELNADCLAGAFWAGAEADGAVIVEEGDAEAVYQFLADAGSGTWMDPGDHGTSQQRRIAFADGYDQGTGYCRYNY
jgi:predicted metalloprotease